MKKILLILSVVLAVFSLFVSCDNNPDVVRYHVTVRNDGEVYKEKDVADGDVYVLPAKPRNDSRPFKGWLLGEEILQPGEEVKITSDTVITAVWTETCTVSFDLGDETLGKIESLTVEKGGTVKKPAAPSRTGYTFSSWKLNGNDFSFDTPITESITLVAEWSINTYTVTFDLCGSSLDKIDYETVAYGAHATEPLSSSIPDRTGYAFAGWYLNEEKYDFGTAVVTEDITLKAHWTTNYCIVTFDTDGGEAMSSLKIPYGEKINIAGTPADPTRAGCTFEKWVLEDGTTEFSFDDEITRDTTIKALWNINEYEVSFDLGYEGASSIASQNVKYGNRATPVTDPARTGYVFTGWKDKDAGLFDFANKITRKTELVAQWSEITTSLTLLFPKDVSYVDTVVVQIGSQEKTFRYAADGIADGDYLKFTATVNGLDYGDYTITVETKDSDGNKVGTSHFDTLVLNSLTADKEVQVDKSVIVDITPTITATATSVTGTTKNYVIKGTASMQCADNTTVRYSTDGNTPTETYTSGAAFDVTNSTTLSYTVTYTGSNWCTGNLSYSGKIDTDIPINTIGATGPAGGIIFYDEKTVKSNSTYSLYSWRFFEASSKDLTKCAVGPTDTAYNDFSKARGKGKENTERLKGIGDGYAAAKCVAYSVTVNGVEYNDWFLPSKTELLDMIKAHDVVGNISTHQYYASSSVFSSWGVCSVLLQNDGTIKSEENVDRNTTTLVVRPIRCF